MSRESLYRHPAIELLRNAIRRELRLQLILSLLLLLCGVLLCLFFFPDFIIMTIIGLATTIIGIRLVYQTALRLRLDRSSIMHLLQEEPHRVVWVYSVVTERLPFGFQFSRSGTLYVKTDDAETYSVSLPANKLKLVSKTLNRLLPHATFGYSVDKDQWFQESPEKLRRRLP